MIDPPPVFLPAATILLISRFNKKVALFVLTGNRTSHQGGALYIYDEKNPRARVPIFILLRPADLYGNTGHHIIGVPIHLEKKMTSCKV